MKADGEISYFHGPVRRFLHQPEGAPTHSVFDILPPPLRGRAREAIKAVSEGEMPSHRNSVSLPGEDRQLVIGPHPTTLQPYPAPNAG